MTTHRGVGKTKEDHLNRRKIIWSSSLSVAAVLVVLIARTMILAEGTEALGPAAITIATGTGVVSGGVGLETTQPGTINVTVPAGATIKQVLLYWEGHFNVGQPPDNTIVIEGTEVTGALIGGPTNFFQDVLTVSYRADITNLGLVTTGGNSLEVEGLNFSRANNGAGILVIIDDGSTAATIQVRDGEDDAFINFAPPLNATVPQTYTFPAALSSRTANLVLMTGSVQGPLSGSGPHRPNSIEVTVNGGPVQIFSDALGSANGPEWDTLTLPITIPAGATTLTVQLFSRDDRSSGDLPASLAWVSSTLSVPGAADVCPPDDHGDDHEGDDHQGDDHNGDDHNGDGDDHNGDDHNGDDHNGDDHNGDDHNGDDRHRGIEASRLGQLTVKVLPNGDVTARFDQSPLNADNCYGANARDWPVSHSIADFAQDYAEFVFKDRNGNVVADFNVDYLSNKGSAPSGYASLGVSGGEGRMLRGRKEWVQAKTSLSENLNSTGFCRNGNCQTNGVNLRSTSPAATSAHRAVDPRFNAWTYTNSYTVTVKRQAFGSAGFGSASVPFVFNKKAKQGAQGGTETGECPDDHADDDHGDGGDDHDGGGGDDHAGDDHAGDDRPAAGTDAPRTGVTPR